jgi:hypothetical protein
LTIYTLLIIILTTIKVIYPVNLIINPIFKLKIKKFKTWDNIMPTLLVTLLKLSKLTSINLLLVLT